ncbi:hypothetical protein [Sphingomonas sp.]
MKLIALATALAFGGAAFAQTTPTMPEMAEDAPMQQQTAPAPAQSSAPMQDQPMAGDTTMQNAPTGGQGQMTSGGYMPAQPPIAGGTPPANATVRFQPSMSPSQAFPPPPPKDEYPVCTRGQTDGCRQRGG